MNQSVDQPLDEDMYSQVMHEVFNVAGTRFLTRNTKSSNHGRNYEQNNEGLVDVLVTASHDVVVETLIEDSNSLEEALKAYFKVGKYEKLVDLLIKNESRNPDFDLELLFIKIVTGEINTDYTYKLLDYINSNSRLSYDRVSLFRKLVGLLWQNSKFELSSEIIERYFNEREKVVLRMQQNIIMGEKVEDEEILRIAKSLALELESSDYFVKHDISEVLVNLFLFLNEQGVSLKVMLPLKSLLVELNKKHSLGISKPLYDFDKKVVVRLLKENCLEDMESFFKGESIFKEKIRYRLIQYYAKFGDTEKCNAMLSLEIQNLENVLIESLKKLKGSKEEFSMVDVGWFERIDCYRLLAKLYGIKAIYSSYLNDAVESQKYMQLMMDTVELVSVPIRQVEPPLHHRKSLEKHRRFVKRSIKEQFLDLGEFKLLPKVNGWSTKIMTLEDKQLVSAERKKKLGTENNINKDNVVDNIPDKIDEALKNNDIDNAIQILKDLVGKYIKEYLWELGMQILKFAPGRFDELLQLLERDCYSWRQGVGGDPNFAIAQFYIEGVKRGVANNEHLNLLLNKWRKTLNSEEGRDSLPEDGVVTLIEGLVEAGFVKEAWDIYLHCKNRFFVSKYTVSRSLAVFFKVASENQKADSGIRRAVLGNESIDDMSKFEQIAYWNAKVEIALMKKDNEAYKESLLELNKLLGDTESIQLWTRLLMAGTLRDPHQKKNEIIALHNNEHTEDLAKWSLTYSMIEQKVVGVEAMPVIKSKKTPSEVALYLFERLIEQGYLDKSTRNYLTEEHLPYLRRLLSEYQGQFNTVMISLNEYLNGDEWRSVSLEDSLEVEFAEVGKTTKVLNEQGWELVFIVLRRVGVLTPGIYAEAVDCNFNIEKLDEIAQRLKNAKKTVFLNIPRDKTEISDALYAELVYTAYQPANMSLSEVRRFCRDLQDCSSQLGSLVFPLHGYAMDLNIASDMQLKPNVALAVPKIQFRKHEVNLGTTDEEQIKHVRSQIRMLCEVGRLKIDTFDLDDFFSVIPEHSFLYQAAEGKSSYDPTTQYKNLLALKEAFGIYLEDNLVDLIREYLEKHYAVSNEMIDSFVDALGNPGKRLVIERQLGIKLDMSKSNIEIAAMVIGTVILKKCKFLPQVRKLINEDIRKFVRVDGSDLLAGTVKLKAVISKNVASFFAKSSAGLCTSHDTQLFAREDHFHINLIDESAQKCVGNVQAYIMKDGDQKYLFLRGINPSTNLLKNVDAGSIAESIIAIGKQFVTENSLDGLYLSTQGSFIALSNRPEVFRYISQKYDSSLEDIPPFAITRYQNISSAYKIV